MYKRQPFDFTDKNFFALEDQHKLLKAIFFPESLEPAQRFDLRPDDYTFLYRYMSQLPMETSYPEHYSDDYYAVSYTHLDVYKRQRQGTPYRRFGRYMQHHRAETGTAHAPVGDAHHVHHTFGQ